ncbi:glutamyl-tRNA reductase [Clostridium ganghwense]|uniref:Glutamyl-tRNA reductase n=1 Tax=Clostridium ganghwense TaxID=312089 RepID=A0ABT4CSZ0_9CLOT|nr:glutamyl-tRNA reductase [Clostridium ganghwense]MCY6372188.1 glutamyl-tRNA reductase [Clostridium ganghwense]
MIQLIGLRSNIELNTREKFSIIQKHSEECLKKLLSICEEAVIISTCNRTEIYFNSEIEDESILEKIFEALGWNLDLIKYVFHLKERAAVKHLMEVACGFHSKILGEDQILGQIKTSYNSAIKIKAVTKELQRLFQLAITCGKEFKVKSELYKIPVSSSSIVVNESRKRGIRSFMILGYGDVGKLTAKYILSGEFDEVYISVRNVDSVSITDNRVKVIPFNERKLYYKDVDCIISCTSAPHCVITSEDLQEKDMIIFDLAVPRDVHEDVYKMEKVKVYDIDHIGFIDDENRNKRKKLMLENRCIIDKHIEEFITWRQLRKITPHIKKMKKYGEDVYKERYTTFRNKRYTKDTEALAKTLLKSTSDAYINRAIEILKEEQLKGREKECLRILEKIFCPQS